MNASKKYIAAPGQFRSCDPLTPVVVYTGTEPANRRPSFKNDVNPPQTDARRRAGMP